MPKKTPLSATSAQENLASSAPTKKSTKTKKRATTQKTTKKPSTRKKAIGSTPVTPVMPAIIRAKPEQKALPNSNSFIQNYGMMILFWCIVFIIMVVLGRGYALYQVPISTIISDGSSAVGSQHLKVAHNVDLTPDIIDALGYVVPKISLTSKTILIQVVSIEDAPMYRLRSPSFFADVQAGDIAFEFNDALVLYRPSTKGVVNKKMMP